MTAKPDTISIREAGAPGAMQGAHEAGTDAFGEIYNSYHRRVLQLCRRFFGRPEEAEDAAAEVFLKVHSRMASYDPSLPFTRWLVSVAHNHCIDRLHRRRLEERIFATGDSTAVVPDMSSLNPVTLLLRAEVQRRVREEVSRLPEQYRLPLVLRYYDEMSYKEIAATLDRKLETVKTSIFRTKRELRRKVGIRNVMAGSPPSPNRRVATDLLRVRAPKTYPAV